MIRILFVLLFFLPAINTHACLNLFAIDSAGRVVYLEHYFFAPVEFNKSTIAANLKKLQKQFDKNEYNYKNISDYGAWLLMAGRSKEGLDIFRALSKKYPGIYEILANAAVAYELNGKIDSAYLLQEAALRVNPNAHNKSEWIHLKILEARKKILADPDWALSNNVTGIADSIKKYYKYGEHDLGEGMWFHTQAIDQLEDRFPFTHAEDKAMGKFLFELGDSYQFTAVYRAYYCYAIARYLYPALGAAADKKMKEIREKYPKNSVQSGRRTIALTPKSTSEREMLLPSDANVNQFINKLINRPALKSFKIKPVSTEQLIDKI